MQSAVVKTPKWTLKSDDIYFEEEVRLVQPTGECGRIVGQPEFEVYTLDGKFDGFAFKDNVCIIESPTHAC